MKALETFWNGITYRSRVEARWAVAFEAMGWGARYEPEAFRFDDGTCYLPDFWISALDAWGEVKGKPFEPEETRKAKLLAAGSGKPCLTLIADPHVGPIPMLMPDGRISVSLYSLPREAVWLALAERFQATFKEHPRTKMVLHAKPSMSADARALVTKWRKR